MKLTVHSLGSNHLEVTGIEQQKALNIAQSLTDTKPARIQICTGDGICFVASKAVFAVEVFPETDEEREFIFAQEKESQE